MYVHWCHIQRLCKGDFYIKFSLLIWLKATFLHIAMDLPKVCHRLHTVWVPWIWWTLLSSHSECSRNLSKACIALSKLFPTEVCGQQAAFSTSKLSMYRGWMGVIRLVGSKLKRGIYIIDEIHTFNVYVILYCITFVKLL